MTADEWNECRRSDFMFLPLHKWLNANPGAARRYDRKFLLYAVACCRQRWELFSSAVFRRAVDAAERYADGGANRDEMQALYTELMNRPTPDAPSHALEEMTIWMVSPGSGIQLLVASAMQLGTATGWDDFEMVTTAQAPLLRCIVGNPFRPVACEPSWRTSTAVGLAEGIYADHAFDRLPILADALEEAGCDDADVLGHCRGDGPHARGCWVVDLVLGKP
jgi:hypothetical protein